LLAPAVFAHPSTSCLTAPTALHKCSRHLSSSEFCCACIKLIRSIPSQFIIFSYMSRQLHLLPPIPKIPAVVYSNFLSRWYVTKGKKADAILVPGVESSDIRAAQNTCKIQNWRLVIITCVQKCMYLPKGGGADAQKGVYLLRFP